MKPITLLLAAFLFAAPVFSQQANPFPKTITVSGSAEMEIVPDEIYVNIELREYQKRGEDKKELEVIKSDFLGSCRAVGIADSCISIFSYSGFNNYYYLLRRANKKQPDMMAGITYQVKFSSSKLMDALVEKLDDEATRNFQIVSTSHSKMTEFRKQLKIQAVKAAKDKAIYLTEAIGEKLGAAITIKEPDETPIMPRGSNGYVNTFNTLVNYKGMDDKRDVELDFRKIRLRYEVNVIFSL